MKTVQEMKNVLGQTPLHKAIVYNAMTSAALLLEAGACPDTIDRRGTTSLHCASVKGHVEAVKLLLQHGANPRIKDTHQQTPADYCANQGSIISLDDWENLVRNNAKHEATQAAIVAAANASRDPATQVLLLVDDERVEADDGKCN